MGLFTSEEESTDYDDDEPMTVTELRDSIRRVLGVDLPLGEPTRLTRFTFHARQVERYRDGRILLAGDAAHLFPAPGVALDAGLLDSVNLGWKLAAAHPAAGRRPACWTRYHDERRLAAERTHAARAGPGGDAARPRPGRRRRSGSSSRSCSPTSSRCSRLGALMAGTDVRYPSPGPGDHALIGSFAPDLARPVGARAVLLDLADREDLREIARDWQHRVDIHTAEAEDRPADALLIRPDAHIAWAAAVDEPSDTAAPALREALGRWFGAPLTTTAA